MHRLPREIIYLRLHDGHDLGALLNAMLDQAYLYICLPYNPSFTSIRFRGPIKKCEARKEAPEEDLYGWTAGYSGSWFRYGISFL